MGLRHHRHAYSERNAERRRLLDPINPDPVPHTAIRSDLGLRCGVLCCDMYVHLKFGGTIHQLL